MTDLAVFFKDLPINPTISENSKEKICVENFLAKNRKAPNKKQTCRKKRKKNSTQFAKTKSVQNVLAG